jgi:four helix bundle protein
MEMKKNVLLEKSYGFALEIIEIYVYLSESKREYVLSKQLLRSGTSVGANAEESVGGRSRADFINKVYISYKEARETHYWLRLLRDSKFLSPTQVESLLNKCDELLKIMGAIIATTEKTMKR